MIEKEHHDKSALHVQEGIDQPSAVNPEAARKFSKPVRNEPDAATYIKGIREENRSLLSKAITLVESSLPRHQELAQKIIIDAGSPSGFDGSQASKAQIIVEALLQPFECSARRVDRQHAEDSLEVSL